jgi:hypothetical protein
MFRRYTNVIGDSTGGVKIDCKRILKPGPEVIKTRTVNNSVGELALED